MHGESAVPNSAEETTCFTESMVELLGIIEHAIDVEMENDASPSHLANASVLALCRVLGGTAIYLPRATALKKKLRNLTILKDFKAGMLVRDIAKKHRISGQLVYDIIGPSRISSRLLTEAKGKSNE
ncbi:hypothetical protein QEM14_003859 [Pseudomonas putida]|nr:hypothetical protein [Pseudomonas putida]